LYRIRNIAIDYKGSNWKVSRWKRGVRSVSNTNFMVYFPRKIGIFF